MNIIHIDTQDGQDKGVVAWRVGALQGPEGLWGAGRPLGREGRPHGTWQHTSVHAQEWR